MGYRCFVQDMLATSSFFRFDDETSAGGVGTPETRREEMERERMSAVGIRGGLRCIWVVLVFVLVLAVQRGVIQRWQRSGRRAVRDGIGGHCVDLQTVCSDMILQYSSNCCARAVGGGGKGGAWCVVVQISCLHKKFCCSAGLDWTDWIAWMPHSRLCSCHAG